MKQKKSTYITIDRSLLNWRWYKDGNTTRLFLHLLLTANIKKSGMGEINVGRGEVVTSYESVANTLGLSKQEVRTAFRHLKATGEITVTRYSKFSVISIVNYDLYQSRQHREQHTDEHSPNTQPTVGKHHLNNIRIERIKDIYKGLGVSNDGLLTAYAEFEIMRVDNLKKPLTEKGRERLVKKVNGIAESTAEQVRALERATDGCWLSVYGEHTADKTSENGEMYSQYIDGLIKTQEEES